VDLTAFDRTRVVSVLPTGEPVLSAVDGGAFVDLTIVDPATGQPRRHVRVELRDDIAAAGLPLAPVDETLIFTTDGRVLVRPMMVFDWTPTASTPTQAFVPSDVLVVDLATERVVQVWRLPTPTAEDYLRSVRMVPEGLLLARWTPTKRWSLDLYDPATDTLSQVSDLSALPGKPVIAPSALPGK
jgi:hypothetical protein